MNAKNIGCGCLCWIVIIIGGIIWIGSCQSKKSTPPATPEQLRLEAERRAAEAAEAKSYSDKLDAWVTTQYLVEEKLLSPKSAKFPFGGAREHVEETAPGIFIIRSYVDSQNAFGVEVRQRFFCKLAKRQDGKFEVIQLTFQ
jgi:hypothetical protein